jgi:hypothetical protein
MSTLTHTHIYTYTQPHAYILSPTQNHTPTSRPSLPQGSAATSSRSPVFDLETLSDAGSMVSTESLFDCQKAVDGIASLGLSLNMNCYAMMQMLKNSPDMLTLCGLRAPDEIALVEREALQPLK